MSDNLAHALAGAGGGVLSMALTYPLITISTRQQVQKDNQAKNAYKGQLGTLKKIIKEEGIQGLYSGLSSGIFGIAVTNGIYYYFYEFTKTLFEKTSRNSTLTTSQSMTAGALAGAAVATLTNPIWVVNTRLTTRKNSVDDDKQSKNPKAPLNTVSTILEILKEDGPWEFWRGLIPALILVVNPIIQYTAFENMKSRLIARRGTSGNKGFNLTGWDFFLMGAISKLIATSLTYPYIVIKSRMQLRQSTDGSARYDSVLNSLSKIIRQEGIHGLYKGIQSKLIQSVLTSAFLFWGKEALYIYAVNILILLGMRQKILK